jgi:hypothetical protein
MHGKRSNSRKVEKVLKAREEGFNMYMGGANEQRAKEKDLQIKERGKSKTKVNDRVSSKDRFNYMPKVENSPPRNVSL